MTVEMTVRDAAGSVVVSLERPADAFHITAAELARTYLLRDGFTMVVGIKT
jgi:hypothetical protein